MTGNERLEHEIDQALQSLRAVQPEPGMQGRVLARVRQRTATPRGARSRRGLPAWPLSWTVYGAVATSALAVWAASHHDVPRKPSQPAPLTSVTRIVPPVQPAPQHTSAQPAIVTAHTEIPQKPARPATFANAKNAQPVAASFLPSIAPPPPELTEQERLLVRIAQNGSPQELRALDPSLRAELDRQDRAEFDRFFPQPAPTPAPANVVLPPLVPPPLSLPPLEPPPLTPPTREGDAR